MPGRLPGQIVDAVAFILVCLVANLQRIPGASAESFSERLGLVQQKDGTVLASFSFEIDVDHSSLSLAREGHYSMYPYQLGEAVREAEVQDLHLTMSYGHWAYEKWGASQFRAPQGLEIWGSTRGGLASEDQEKQWASLIGALSSIVSPGISTIDISAPWSERYSRWEISSLEGKGVNSGSSMVNSSRRHVYMPRYVLCIENIRSFFNLLPCKNKAGFASLINSSELFEKAKYLSIGVELGHYRTEENYDDEQLSILLTMGIVLDPGVSGSGHGQLGHSNYWNLSTLFSSKIKSMCTLTDSSTIKVYGARSGDSKALGNYDVIEQHPSGRTLATYNIVSCEHIEDIGLEISDNIDWSSLPIIYEYSVKVDRYISGILGKNSNLVAKIQNIDPVESKSTVYLQTFPWFVRPLLHTLEISAEKNETRISSEDISGPLRYTPAGANKTLNVLEIDLLLPPSTSVTLRFRYNFIFRKHSDYYADIDRLMDIGQSVLTVYDSLDVKDAASEPLFATQKHRLFFNALSVRFPTTDFSMPFNVVLAVSLFFSLCFCSIVNILIRCYKVPTSDVILEDA